jgi:iron complex outermembrane recepter protein
MPVPAHVAETPGSAGPLLSDEPAGPQPIPSALSKQEDAAQTASGVSELQTVTVTGTRIRGGATPSPLTTIGSEHIREEGFTDLGEVIRSVPQNFSGGQNPGVVTATGSGNIYNQNATGGSSLNLRGIGADATLTLLNGRRLAYGGFVNAVDISMIPVEAVERLEVVADGASALYGSDAVAGVANVLLKRDFEGVALGARYGAATSGGLATHDYGATVGTIWEAGGLMAAYKNVSANPIRADQRGFTRSMTPPFVIYPGSDTRSALVTGHQALGDRAEARLDLLRTTREQGWYNSYPGFYFDNAFKTTSSFAAPSVAITLPGRWELSAGGAWGRDENLNITWFVVGSDTERVVDACYCNDSRAYDVGVEGPLWSGPGGDVRMAAGAGKREVRYQNISYLDDRREGGDEHVRFAYAELAVPLAPTGGARGPHRLVLTAAARHEAYDSFGSVTTPKLGLVYSPTASYTAKASWGRSFKAPTLSQLYANRLTVLWRAADVGATDAPAEATVLMAFGGNPGLDPERARTATASLAFHPVALPGLEAELTWFDIDYTDRVVQPLPIYSQALSDPTLAEFIAYAPTAPAQADLIATYADGFINYAGADYDAGNVLAIAYGQFTNAMRQGIRGVDLSASYRTDLGLGRMTARGSASWLESTQQTSAAQAPVDLAGTLFYPARVRARAGLVLERNQVTASVFGNYTDGVTDRATGGKSGSFTTLDTTVRYLAGPRRGWMPEVEVALSAQNLLGRDPPLYAFEAVAEVPYDSTNYSAVGRFVSLSLSTRW